MNAGAALRAAHRYLMNTYRRPQLVFTRGRGCYIYDHRGRRYLDFLGGIAVNALGHAHPAVVRALRRQAARAIHVSNLYHNEFQGPLAEQLAACSGMDRVFFTNSGSEAVETALKLARAYAKQKTNGASRVRLLALDGAFHGRTFGALSATAQPKYHAGLEPMLAGFACAPFGDLAAAARLAVGEPPAAPAPSTTMLTATLTGSCRARGAAPCRVAVSVRTTRSSSASR